MFLFIQLSAICPNGRWLGLTHNTGWGKITSTNFKVNNKKNYSRYKHFTFGFWNYNMGSFKSHILKKNILQVVAVVCVVFACRAPGRLQNGPTSDSLDVLCCSRVPWSSSSFFRHTSRFPEVLNPQQNGFSVPRGDLVASTERTLHRYDRVTLRKVGFDGKCALLVGPHHLYDCGVL